MLLARTTLFSAALVVLAATTQALAQANPAIPYDKAFTLNDASGSYHVARLYGEQPAPAADDSAEPAAPAAQPTPPRVDRRSLLAYRGRSFAQAPHMFGDALASFGRVSLLDPDDYGMHSSTYAFVDVPSAGGAGRLKIGENNRAIADDRCFFIYNHFHNALTAQDNSGNIGNSGRDFHVDRAIYGLERRVFDMCTSVEVRVPVVSQDNFSFTDSTFGPAIVDGGNLGNISLILKRVLSQSDTASLAVGLGVNLPTGEDVDLKTLDYGLTIDNEALYLLPFIGVTGAPNDVFFYHGFAQLDLAANGNSVNYRMPRTSERGYLGKYTDQTLLQLDGSIGAWMFRNPCGQCLTGLAGLVELHYITAMQDTDVLSVPVDNGNYIAALANPFNRVDVLNLTAGLHVQLASNTSLRFAAAVPLRGESDRFVGTGDRLFDAEFYFSANRQY